ncbi:MAG: glycosyltransferase, partial [Acidobacteria bacterium]
MPKLSVVVPVYREAASIRRNFEVLKAVLDAHAEEFSYEIILVNDGSPDESLTVLESLHRDYPSTTGIVSFLRNFGQVAAILAGLQASSGSCAAVISADLQDPPELIPVMFRKWSEGWKTVVGVRGARYDSLIVKAPSRLFYSLMRRHALPSLPATGFDFFLIDQTVKERLVARPEPNGFLQGEILYASGPVHEIVYTRREREAGDSGWSSAKKMKYFVDGFVGYSFAPIRFITVAGIGLFCLGILASVGLVIQRLWFGTR